MIPAPGDEPIDPARFSRDDVGGPHDESPHGRIFPDGTPIGEPPPDGLAWPDAPDSPGPELPGGDVPETAETAAGETYWSLSRTPLTSLVFTLPLVAAYEGGVLLLGRGSPRNGADVWLRQLLDALGFGQYFLLPALTVTGLLAWQFLAHQRWRLSLAVLPGMTAECLLWAAVLVGIGRMQGRLWPFPAEHLAWEAVGLPLAAGIGGSPALARLIGFCGAGLYEEVLFRLLMLPIAVWIFEKLGSSRLAAGCWAVVWSSLLFSAAHYVGPLGDSFAVYSFTFRVVAGLFFALLFLWRGFGIAAGTHFFYDLLVGLL